MLLGIREVGAVSAEVDHVDYEVNRALQDLLYRSHAFRRKPKRREGRLVQVVYDPGAPAGGMVGVGNVDARPLKKGRKFSFKTSHTIG